MPMNYNRADDGKIYQTNPRINNLSQFKAKGWTSSLEGYLNEANQWARSVLRNKKLMGRPYTWFVTINFNEELKPHQVSPMWQKISRKLDARGIVCLWVREPNLSNKLHYHLVIKNQITEIGLANAIDEAMPPRSLVQWRKRIEPIDNEWRLIHYVFKAKVKGYNKRGILVNDLYRGKRLLFKANLPFRKVGTIGDFWEQGKSKTKIWNDIKAVEKQIGEGLEQPNVRRLCQHVHDLLGEAVPLRRIERSFGHDPDARAVTNWIESLIAGEWAEEDATMAEDPAY